MRIGIDAGGTFTDLVAHDPRTGLVRCHKVPSSPRHPVAALLSSLAGAQVGPVEIEQMIYGTTVATNALLERKGARIAFVTTAGFEDMLYIQRINRQELYNLAWIKSAPLVESRASCFGLSERVLHDGSIARPLDAAEVERLGETIRAQGYEAVAVCLLFAFLNPAHERMIGEIFAAKLGLPFSISHEVAPMWREYERASTTAADAYLKPLVGKYVRELDAGLRRAGLAGPWSLMKSNGGIVAAAAAANDPIQLALSGPAGGMIAARAVAQAIHQPSVVTLDMGGTSADVGIVIDGEQRLTTAYEIEFGLPASIPLIDIRTIGAGGGSIAWVNPGAFLEVGPKSAGANPGPACYGLGGEEPTVTDANLHLGRLDPNYFLDGRMPLSSDRSAAALSRVAREIKLSVEELAAAIIQIAENNMGNAIRMVSVDQGHDPRGFTLIAFGGAGPLHAAAIARTLRIPRVAVPMFPGNLCALGFLLGDARVDKVWTHLMRSDTANPAAIDAELGQARAEVVRRLGDSGYAGEPSVLCSVNLRYLGQNYEHEVPLTSGEISAPVLARALESFHSLHDSLYGYSFRQSLIEFVSFRVTAVGGAERPSLQNLKQPVSDLSPPGRRRVYFPNRGWLDSAIFRRTALRVGDRVEGPAVIQEAGATTVLGPGDRLEVDESGILLIEVKEE